MFAFFRAGRRGYFPFSGRRRRASTVHVDVLPRLHLSSTPPRTQTIYNSSSLPPLLSLPITPFLTLPHLNSRSTMPYSLILHYLLHRILYPHTAFIKSTPVQRHRLASFLFRSSSVSPRSSSIPIRFDLIRSRLSLSILFLIAPAAVPGRFLFLSSVFIPPELSSHYTPFWRLLSDTRSSSPSDSSKVL